MIDQFTIEQAFTALARAKRNAEQDVILLREILAEVSEPETKATLRQTERRIDHYKKGALKLILLAYRKGLSSADINDFKAKLTTKWDLMDAGEVAGSLTNQGQLEKGEAKIDIAPAVALASRFAKRNAGQIEMELRARAEAKGILKTRFYRVLDVLKALEDTRDTRDLDTAEIDAIKKIWAISPSKMTNNLWYAAKQKKVAAKLARKAAQ